MFNATCKNVVFFDKNVYFFNTITCKTRTLAVCYDAGCDFYLVVHLDDSRMFQQIHHAALYPVLILYFVFSVILRLCVPEFAVFAVGIFEENFV